MDIREAGPWRLGERSYHRIAIERREQVLVLALHNPGRANAVDDLLHTELSTVFFDAQADADSRVVVLTGGGDSFSLGGDTSEGRSIEVDPAPSIVEARAIIDGVLAMTKPLLAAVNGDAIGLGATLASLADISYVERRGSVGDPHVWAALPAGNGSALIWPFLVGPNRAKEVLLLGSIVGAEEAARLGLVSHAVDDGTSLERALATAQELAGRAPQAVQGTKAAVNHLLRVVADLVLPASLAAEEEAMRHPDFLAAMAALRPPSRGT